MTNRVTWAVVITGKYAVQSSPREKHNKEGGDEESARRETREEDEVGARREAKKEGGARDMRRD